MFRNIIASSIKGEVILQWIEYAAFLIELLAVVIIVFAIFYSVFRYSYKGILQQELDSRYRELKIHLGKALLLGLEILVAADIVRTVALEASFESVGILGLLVIIRTFLSWALVVELENRWPWQPIRDGEEGM